MMSPFDLFTEWYQTAEKGGQVEPNALVLSCVQESGRPSSRVVLLKHIEEQTFYFFTNYNSKKAQMLDAKPFASYNFHWRSPVHRQVRIEGEIVRASAKISDDYFRSRPRGSQIGAWASPQSQKIANRSDLEKRVSDFEKQFAGREIPRPEYWGGFGLKPTSFEFWEEGEFRLHSRRLFQRGDAGGAFTSWSESLLAP
jgi:pyridoxamine 5'-phosphate oxidase